MDLQLILKIICLFTLLAIFKQDFGERKVYAGLLLSVGIFMPLLYFLETNSASFLINIGVNLSIIIIIIGILYLYATLKVGQPIHRVLGFGDLLFFMIIAISFPITTFLVLFSCSLLFSLVLFLLIKPRLQDKNVPLAGLQALFFLLIFSFNWSFQYTNLYTF